MVLSGPFQSVSPFSYQAGPNFESAHGCLNSLRAREFQALEVTHGDDASPWRAIAQPPPNLV